MRNLFSISGEKFIVVDNYNGCISTSTDGITWTTPEQLKNE